MHPLTKLAKDSVEEFILNGKVLSTPKKFSPEMNAKAGVFVCIKKKGALKGCIGTYSPSAKNIADEIIQNAVSAATKDPRFTPVSVDDLSELEYSVDVLSQPEMINTIEELNPKIYGIIVSKGALRGLLLPDLEGVDTVEEQIRIAALKAGIPPEEEMDIYRFEVKRYK